MNLRIRIVAVLATAALAFGSGTLALAQTAPPPAPAGAPPAAVQPAPAPVAPAARAEDVASLDAILASLYGVISGPAGAQRDWDRFRSLFAPGARLIPIARRPGTPTQARVMTPDDYVTRASAAFGQSGFFEREIARKVDTYGAMTHVFSTYESRHAREEDKPFARGINSIQLLNDGTRWWIVTVYWQSEMPDIPLPDKYLPEE